MNEINADLASKAENLGSDKLTESNFVDIFLAELGRLKRIIAGMGLSASDGEDILHDQNADGDTTVAG